MPITVPSLDDRNYQQILQEALARIPVHTPEWTNFNDSDPGVTMLQLFSFMTESLLYRANQIPARNRLKFLKLLGMGLRPATSARGFITINNARGPLESYPLDAGLDIRAGNIRYRTTHGMGVLPIEIGVFYKKGIPAAELDESTTALYRRLYLDVLQEQGVSELMYYQTTQLPAPSGEGALPVVNISTETTDQTVWIALLARQQDLNAPNPADPNDDPLRDVRTALAGKTLTLGVMPTLDADGLTIEAGKVERTEGEADLQWEIADVRNSATEPRFKTVPSRTQFNLLQEPGWIEITLPDVADEIRTWQLEPGEEGLGKRPPSLTDTNIRDRVVTWLRMRLPDASIPARISWIGINATPIIQQVQVTNEPLNKATGQPDQSITLANTPVLPDSLFLTVNGETWSQVDDILNAAPEVQITNERKPSYQENDFDVPYLYASSAYTLDPESGEIRFGDGAHGTRPPRNASVVASYAFGGGQQGNVGIGAINKSPQLPPGFQITNPLRTWGGDNAETLAEAEKLIPSMIRTRERLVSSLDFYEVTLRTPGVDLGRVEILPLTARDADAPSGLNTNKPGAVTVMVIPLEDGRNKDAPVPDRFFLDTVCRYLQPRRLITTELYIRGPQYIDVGVSIGVQVVPGRAASPVLARVKVEVTDFLSPLFGGRNQTGWPLNTPLLQRELEAIVSRVDGVQLVPEGQLLLGSLKADGTIEERNRIELVGVQLPRLAVISVATETARLLSSLSNAPTSDSGNLFASIPLIPDGC